MRNGHASGILDCPRTGLCLNRFESRDSDVIFPIDYRAGAPSAKAVNLVGKLCEQALERWPVLIRAAVSIVESV